MQESRISELRTLFENPAIYSKILRELNINYLGFIKIHDENNQIVAFTEAVKRIYSIGTNSNLELKSNILGNNNEFRSLNFGDTVSSCSNILRRILEFLSGNNELKKKYAIPEEWKNNEHIQGDFYTLEFLSSNCNVPIKIISQTEAGSELFEQNIINPELLSEKPGIDLVAVKRDKLFVVHVLVSRDSEFQKVSGRTIEIERVENNFKESKKTKLKKLINYYKKSFAVNDKIIEKIQICVRNKTPIIIDKEQDGLSYEISNLRNELNDINPFNEQIDRRLVEPYIFELINPNDRFINGCRICNRNDQNPLRLPCGCWYHYYCLDWHLKNLLPKNPKDPFDAENFKCKCGSLISMQCILSHQYFQDNRFDIIYYEKLGQSKCLECLIFYPKNQVQIRQDGNKKCINCINLGRIYCQYCERNSKNVDWIIKEHKICILCLFEVLYFNRFGCFILGNTQDFARLFISTSCMTCNNETICFFNNNIATCYDCILRSIYLV